MEKEEEEKNNTKIYRKLNYYIRVYMIIILMQ